MSDDKSDEPRQCGVVKWFNPRKGYGFVRPVDGSNEIFVHSKGISGAAKHRTLRENEPVEFLVEVDENGKARCVEVTGPGGASVLGAERSEESADLVMDTEAPAAGNSKRKAPPAAAQGGKSESKRKAVDVCDD